MEWSQEISPGCDGNWPLVNVKGVLQGVLEICRLRNGLISLLFVHSLALILTDKTHLVVLQQDRPVQRSGAQQ